MQALVSELDRLMPSEIIYPEEAVELESALLDWRSQANGYDAYVFDLEHAKFHLLDHFKLSKCVSIIQRWEVSLM